MILPAGLAPVRPDARHASRRGARFGAPRACCAGGIGSRVRRSLGPPLTPPVAQSGELVVRARRPRRSGQDRPARGPREWSTLERRPEAPSLDRPVGPEPPIPRAPTPSVASIPALGHAGSKPASPHPLRLPASGQPPFTWPRSLPCFFGPRRRRPFSATRNETRTRHVTVSDLARDRLRPRRIAFALPGVATESERCARRSP